MWLGALRVSAFSAVVFAIWMTRSYSELVKAPEVAFELGVGFTVLLAVHELGHLCAFRRFGMRASPPAFIPFVGALITSFEIDRRDARTEGLVGSAARSPVPPHHGR